MSAITDLDQATAEVAKQAYLSVPFNDWLSVTCTARVAPHGGAKRIALAIRRSDGSVDKGATPVPEAEEHLDDALSEHWELARAIGPTPWFQMRLVVERSGKYAVDFTYLENYQEGDLFKSMDE